MATLPMSGRAAIASAISKRPLHVAWGSGDGAWLVPPPENSTATALQSELGRLAPRKVVVLGGTGVVSQDVQSQLGAYIVP